MIFFKPDIIDQALEEDVGSGDITTDSIVPKNHTSKAVIIAREAGIIAGLNIAERIFNKATFSAKVKDGDHIKPNQIVAEIQGNTRQILSSERVALNFLQRLSGIATLTNQYVSAAKSVKILDTRKTTPGLRKLEKYAVRMGGGTNHRMGLYDMTIIKDSHIKIAGSITKAVELARKTGKKIEVEVEHLNQVNEAINAQPDIIMLDNMSIADMKKAVKVINKQIPIEASGNMTLERVSQVAKIGVDYISVGALTHSPKALNMSLKLVQLK
jgi:nicotinate-nucleotide pyrophosphorylase (carboxylating)